MLNSCAANIGRTEEIFSEIFSTTSALMIYVSPSLSTIGIRQFLSDTKFEQAVFKLVMSF